MRLSGWCSGPTGAIDGFHEVCRERMAAGLIAVCECPEHANDDKGEAA